MEVSLTDLSILSEVTKASSFSVFVVMIVGTSDDDDTSDGTPDGNVDGASERASDGTLDGIVDGVSDIPSNWIGLDVWSESIPMKAITAPH